MTIKIGKYIVEKWEALELDLSFDSLASTFSVTLFFDTGNRDHRELFRPGAYHKVTIHDDDDNLILTGVTLNNTYSSGSTISLVTITGYSLAGVLMDSEMPENLYPLQSVGLSLKQIAEKCAKAFGVNVVVDPVVAARCAKKYTTSTAKDDQKVQSYLAEIAGQRHVILTHNAAGDVVLTEAKTNQLPLVHLSKENGVITSSGMAFNGQAMHSSITLQKQQAKDGKGNAGHSTVKNPYVLNNAFRPRISRQTSGDSVDTATAVRNVLSDELKNISFSFNMQGWYLNNRLVLPNNIVTVTDPELYLFTETRLFIASVKLTDTVKGKTAAFTCLLPEVFTSETPKNIFL